MDQNAFQRIALDSEIEHLTERMASQMRAHLDAAQSALDETTTHLHDAMIDRVLAANESEREQILSALRAGEAEDAPRYVISDAGGSSSTLTARSPDLPVPFSS